MQQCTVEGVKLYVVQPKKTWKDGKACSRCEAATVFEKHHCRACANIFCCTCANMSVIMATPVDGGNQDSRYKISVEKVCMQCHQRAPVPRRAGTHTARAKIVTAHGIPYVAVQSPLPRPAAQQVFVCSNGRGVRPASDACACAACGFMCCFECMKMAQLYDESTTKLTNVATCDTCYALARTTRKRPTFDTHVDSNNVRYIVCVQRGTERWVPDKSTSLCMADGCERTFSFGGESRHHCRSCGFVVCDWCSRYRTELWDTVKNAMVVNQRVCSYCNDQALQLLPEPPARVFTTVTRGGSRFGVAKPKEEWMNPKYFRHCSDCKAELESDKGNCNACGRLYCASCCPNYNTKVVLEQRSILTEGLRVCRQCQSDAEKLFTCPTAHVTTLKPDNRQCMHAATKMYTRVEHPVCHGCRKLFKDDAKNCVGCGGIYCLLCVDKRDRMVLMFDGGDSITNPVACITCYYRWLAVDESNTRRIPVPRGPPADAIEKFQREKQISLAALPLLRRLQQYDVVVVCDDSGSMNLQNRWYTLQDSLATLLDFTKCSGHKADVYFLNREGVMGVDSMAQVRGCLRDPPKGGTNVVRVLKTIFGDRVTEDMPRGLIVYFFTDGHPTNDNDKEDLKGFATFLRNRVNKGHTYFGVLLLTEEEDVVRAYRSIEYGRSQGKNAIKGLDVTLSYDDERREVEEIARAKKSQYRLTRGDYVAKCLVGCIDMRIHNIDLEVEDE